MGGGRGSFIRAASYVPNNPSLSVVCRRRLRPREAQVINFDAILFSLWLDLGYGKDQGPY